MNAHVAAQFERDRKDALKLALCDPLAGKLAREFLERERNRSPADAALLPGLADWLIFARVESDAAEVVGHA